MDRQRVPRWTDGEAGVPDLLRDAIERERTAVPDEVQLARIAARVGASLGTATTAAPHAGTSSAATGSLATLAKLLGVVALAVVAGLALWRTAHERSQPAVPKLQHAALSAQEPAAVTPAEPIGAVSPVAKPRSTSNPAMRARSGRSVAAQPPKPPVADPPAAPVAAVIAPDELELLRTARSALAGSPARALELATEHMRHHPSGAFAEEREALAIEALVRLGEQPAAHERAGAFIQRFPNSAYSRRITALLAARDAEPGAQ